MTIDHEDLTTWARSLGDPNFTLSVPGHAKTAFRALADALESTTARLREAEAVIEQALASEERTHLLLSDRQPTQDDSSQTWRALSTYKTTNHEIRRQDHA